MQHPAPDISTFGSTLHFPNTVAGSNSYSLTVPALCPLARTAKIGDDPAQGRGQRQGMSMRAVWVGLVGAVLACGVAQADTSAARLGCKLDGLELIASGLPEFEGKRFRVAKVETRFDRLESPPVNDFKSDGYVVALLEGEAGKFVLTETYSRYGMPADYGRLERATPEAIKSINPKQRSAAGERARVNGVFHIFNEDFEGLSLRPSSCK
ncbi:hypothetical protein [Methylobacterium nigriterrae]|uniref:hypothetical protein n=1 Tax=Methylobacterium nigriterrae TaxID=3127512 RepID=UPI003013C68B